MILCHVSAVSVSVIDAGLLGLCFFLVTVASVDVENEKLGLVLDSTKVSFGRHRALLWHPLRHVCDPMSCLCITG